MGHGPSIILEMGSWPVGRETEHKGVSRGAPRGTIVRGRWLRFFRAWRVDLVMPQGQTGPREALGSFFPARTLGGCRAGVAVRRYPDGPLPRWVRFSKR